MDWKIPLFKIYTDDDDIRLVNESISRGMFWAIGPNITTFEAMLAEYVGVRYALAVNSGTAALHAALASHGIGEGDEVIVPSFTFIATANAPQFTGARPVFADIEETTFGLDPDDVRKKITPATKAIIPIHYAGVPCRIKELRKVADENGLILIEDNAESLGAEVNGQNTGSFGDSAILSFCSNKVISTGEGGALLTDSEEVFEQAKLFRSHGRNENANYFATAGIMDYVSLGYNCRMSDITAALGVAQLKKIDLVIGKRQENARLLTERLARVSQVTTPLVQEGESHVYQMYTIKVNEGEAARNALADHLTSKGIMTKIYFPPVHQTHFYREVLGYTCHLPVTEKVSGQVVTLPMYPGLLPEDIDFIADEIAGFFS